MQQSVKRGMKPASFLSNELKYLTVAKPARRFGHTMQIQIIIIINFFRN